MWFRARAATAVGTLLIVAAALLAAVDPGEPVPTGHAVVDRFGIRYLYPTRPGGMTWVSTWSGTRQFDGVDPADPWFDADHGSGRYAVRDGELLITGASPRMYVHDPAEVSQWRDVEVTFYGMRISDAGIPYAGLTAVARANHLRTEDGASDRCDTRGYGARVRFDGHADFEKETAHPDNDATADIVLFPGGLPRETWIGVKYVVRDEVDGVHLELWIDRADGADGGQWQLVDQALDDGHLFGKVPCAPGIDPQLALTSAPDRVGSESGKPNLSVYFRSDGIGPDGLRYKWASIREIQP